MEIGFDFASGAKILRLELPENTTCWFGVQKLLVCPRGELSVTVLDGALTEATLKAMLPPDEITRLADANAAGISGVGALEAGILTEVTFALATDEIGALCGEFGDMDEPAEVLFVRKDGIPALLNLNHYRATHLEQINQRVEDAA